MALPFYQCWNVTAMLPLPCGSQQLTLNRFLRGGVINLMSCDAYYLIIQPYGIKHDLYLKHVKKNLISLYEPDELEKLSATRSSLPPYPSYPQRGGIRHTNDKVEILIPLDALLHAMKRLSLPISLRRAMKLLNEEEPPASFRPQPTPTTLMPNQTNPPVPPTHDASPQPTHPHHPLLPNPPHPPPPTVPPQPPFIPLTIPKTFLTSAQKIERYGLRDQSISALLSNELHDYARWNSSLVQLDREGRPLQNTTLGKAKFNCSKIIYRYMKCSSVVYNSLSSIHSIIIPKTLLFVFCIMCSQAY